MATLWLPSTLLPLTGGAKIVEAEGKNLRELVDKLDGEFSGLKAALVENDKLRPDISMAIDGRISKLGLYQPVCPASEIQLFPVIVGG